MTKEEDAAQDFEHESFNEDLTTAQVFLAGIKWRNETLKQLLTMIDNGHSRADLRLHIKRALGDD